MALYPAHFYNSLLKKYVIAFGSLFADIQVVREDAADNELHRETVPLAFAKKEKFVQRLIEDAALDKKTAIKLPRMSFEYTGLNYAPERKITSKRRVSKTLDGSHKDNVYNPIPYDIEFSLSVYSKTQEEALQIVEQILPFFSPDYTIKVKGIDNPDICMDVPINLIAVNHDDPYEGAFEDNRVIVWELTFLMKAYIFGPLRQSKVIKQAITKVIDDEDDVLATIQVEPYIEGVALEDILATDPYTFLTTITEAYQYEEPINDINYLMTQDDSYFETVEGSLVILNT